MSYHLYIYTSWGTECCTGKLKNCDSFFISLLFVPIHSHPFSPCLAFISLLPYHFPSPFPSKFLLNFLLNFQFKFPSNFPSTFCLNFIKVPVKLPVKVSLKLAVEGFAKLPIPLIHWTSRYTSRWSSRYTSRWSSLETSCWTFHQASIQTDHYLPSGINSVVLIIQLWRDRLGGQRL